MVIKNWIDLQIARDREKIDYLPYVDKVDSLEDLDFIVELASHDDRITNEEYCDIYDYALKKAQEWR